MNRFFTLVSTLLLFTVYTAQAQTSGPRKPPTATRPATAESESDSRAADLSSAKASIPAETRVVNGLSIALKRVKGNSADQTVTLDLLITNPKGNTQVAIHSAEAFDPEGDKYNYPPGGHFLNEVLYTDVARKASVRVAGIPSKVKSLSLFKFVLWTQLANQEVVVEYRNLPIEW